ncbi:hypothetical protein L1987_46887 [Smallanthus sonchifolius]|uniref:Uncharacterized protein n=1 Tax=Smallanthus sonchifolius TaxID=185202 RepID=A0ACB9G229_9ASTR|nr:hypothetical protein L1987_46887 [Smallanthus sonchifolius]
MYLCPLDTPFKEERKPEKEREGEGDHGRRRRWYFRDDVAEAVVSFWRRLVAGSTLQATVKIPNRVSNCKRRGATIASVCRVNPKITPSSAVPEPEPACERAAVPSVCCVNPKIMPSYAVSRNRVRNSRSDFALFVGLQLRVFCRRYRDE